jgi:hypothetical protein
MEEIINQIKQIEGIKEIYKAGDQTLVITLNLIDETKDLQN